ncbi:MAG: hypothetical protein MJA31_16010 [Clostridia bacterium]|nr:hypothetical protein [Clostridia bacterium]
MKLRHAELVSASKPIDEMLKQVQHDGQLTIARTTTNYCNYDFLDTCFFKTMNK